MRWRPSRKRRAVTGLVIAGLVAVVGATALLLATSAGGLAATRTGRLPRARLQEALLRVLALKRRYGLLR